MADIQSITVYLGSSGSARDVFRNGAANLGREIAEGGIKLVYGGMDAGLMGILADAALEAGGEVLGVIPQKILDIERFRKGLTENIFVDDLWERKRLLFQHGDAIVALPGGYGTLDESLEALYWGSLGLHDKPMVFVNIAGYWDLAIKHLNSLPDLDRDYLLVVEREEDVIPALKEWDKPDDIEEDISALPHFEEEILQNVDTPIIIDVLSIAESYRLVSALGLKQVGAHDRPIGLLNKDGGYDNLIEWVKVAAREKFITDKCPRLMAWAKTEKGLMDALERREKIVIDLHGEKWGKR